MEPSQLRWLKKVFCFMCMEKLGFWKVSENFLEGFCSASLTVDCFKFPAFLIFYSSYLQTTRNWEPKTISLVEKTTSNNKVLTLRYVYFQIIYNLSDFLWSTAKTKISHTKSYKILKMSLLMNSLPPTLSLGCLCPHERILIVLIYTGLYGDFWTFEFIP